MSEPTKPLEPKVKIGSAYQPERREVRGNNGYYESYRGWLDRDMARLQDALLNPEPTPVSEWVWSVIGLVIFVGLLTALAFIGPEVLR